MEDLIVVGVDLASSREHGAKRDNRTGLAALDADLRLLEAVAGRFADPELLERILAHHPRLVAIDSPLGLPGGQAAATPEEARARFGIYRQVDREMARHGMKPFPTLLPSMVPLTLRGIWLKEALQRHNVEAIEVYPGAAQDILNIGRKQAGLLQLLAGLERLGIRGRIAGRVDGDQLDAITAAYVGWCYLRSWAETLGEPAETIVFPAPGLSAVRGGRIEIEALAAGPRRGRRSS